MSLGVLRFRMERHAGNANDVHTQGRRSNVSRGATNSVRKIHWEGNWCVLKKSDAEMPLGVLQVRIQKYTWTATDMY